MIHEKTLLKNHSKSLILLVFIFCFLQMNRYAKTSYGVIVKSKPVLDDSVPAISLKRSRGWV